MSATTIYFLKIERFRGIKDLSWHPAIGVNVILGGGDVGKTTILDAIGLLLNPTNATNLSDSDYYARNIEAEFSIEGVFSLSTGSGINEQTKQSWPWEWNGTQATVPSSEGDAGARGAPVYRLRARGTADLELAYEIVQPDGETTNLSVSLRRSIGLVRLGGDDRNDRDLRLVQGSALDRLLSDKGLRSRIASDLAKSDVKDRLLDDKKAALEALDEEFKKNSLPAGLDIAITGSQGLSIAALIGLTAKREGMPLPLPLATWGAGTRRLAALAITAQNQGESPITLVDEVERGLEPYRQYSLIEKMQAGESQVFLTTHSPSVISAASKAALWYVDHLGEIGRLESAKVEAHRKKDPETFLARLTIVAEGKTEAGFVTFLLEKALGSSLQQHGIHVTEGGGNESTLGLLEALGNAGLKFAGFVDNEGKNSTPWGRVASILDKLLFRWTSGCTEENVINGLPDDLLEALLNDTANNKTGYRLRTLADRLGSEVKDFATIRSNAGSDIKALVLSAALGTVPADKATDRKEKHKYESHAQSWFKSDTGGPELAAKMFSLGMWPALQPQLLPFCNAIRKAVGLPEIPDIAP